MGRERSGERQQVYFHAAAYIEENPKHEFRNPKQIQNDERQNTDNVPNNADSDSKFWIFRVWNLFDCVCFEFRYSDFEFNRVSGLFRSAEPLSCFGFDLMWRPAETRPLRFFPASADARCVGARSRRDRRSPSRRARESCRRQVESASR